MTHPVPIKMFFDIHFFSEKRRKWAEEVKTADKNYFSYDEFAAFTAVFEQILFQGYYQQSPNKNYKRTFSEFVFQDGIPLLCEKFLMY